MGPLYGKVLVYGPAYSVFCYSIVKTSYYIQRNMTVDLAHKIYGNNDQIKHHMFILHGLLGSQKNWASISKALVPETNGTVVAVDLRNHGESPHSEDHSYRSLALDVAKLIEVLNAKNVTLIGHSMGGRTTMVLALTQPELVKRLVAVDISPISTPGLLSDFFPRLIDLMRSVEFNPADNVAQNRAMVKLKFIKSDIVEDPDQLGFILMNVGQRKDGTIGWVCNLDALKEHFNQIASFPSDMAGHKFLGPTLFIGGKQSSYLPSSDLEGIRRYFPEAKLKYVDNAGHNVHTENPTKFKEIVVDFIKNT